MSIVGIALTFLTDSSYTVFLTFSGFTVPLRWLKSTGLVSNLLISNLPISVFMLAKSIFLASFDVLTYASSDFVA